MYNKDIQMYVPIYVTSGVNCYPHRDGFYLHACEMCIRYEIHETGDMVTVCFMKKLIF